MPKSAHLWALGQDLGQFGGYWAWIWAISGAPGPGFGILRWVLGLGSDLFGPIWGLLDWIWAILGAPGPGFGPFWAYFMPKLAHLGDLGLDLGHFGGSWAWIWAISCYLALLSGASGLFGPLLRGFGPIFVLFLGIMGLC